MNNKISDINYQIDLDRQQRAGDDPRRLEHFGFKVFSQSDEDGIIEEIFNRIGTTNRIFVDFGAETGNENNTRYLLEQGWTGLWIETFHQYANAIRYEQRDRIESGQLKFLEEAVTAENINDLILGVGIKGEIDFLSIDIDGNDYHVFKAIRVIQPRVLCLEHNGNYEPPEEWIMPYCPTYYWTSGSSKDYGASIVSMEKLAFEKGYILVGCGLYSPNGFYIRSDLLGQEKFSAPFCSSRFFNPVIEEKIFSFPKTKYGSPIICEKLDSTQPHTHFSSVEVNYLSAPLLVEQLSRELEIFTIQTQQRQATFDHLQAKFYTIQQELADEQAQHCELQTKLTEINLELQQDRKHTKQLEDQLREKPKQLEDQLYQTLDKLSQIELNLQRKGEDLEEIQRQLEHKTRQLEHKTRQLELTRNRIKQQKSKLLLARKEVKRKQEEIDAMQASKFWKLREKWIQIKNLLKQE